jgi:hypothetical protein
MEDKDFVACQICGHKAKTINHLHLRIHGISVADYLKKFPSAKVICETSLAVRNQKLKGRKITWASKISTAVKKSWTEDRFQGRTGVPLSASSRKKLSLKLQGHLVSESTREKIGLSGMGRTPWNTGMTKDTDGSGRMLSISRKVAEWNKKHMTAEMRSRISQSVKKKYANGMPVPNSRVGFREDLAMSFRSSWEANYARFLKHTDKPILYETDRFVLNRDGTIESVYVTDFKMAENRYIEIKGHAESSSTWTCQCSRCQRDKNKMRLMSVQHPHVVIEIFGKKEYGELKTAYSKVVPNWETITKPKRQKVPDAPAR